MLCQTDIYHTGKGGLKSLSFLSTKKQIMKAIIQRSLPLNVRYVLTDKKYIPILEGGGSCCDNCGKLIANIATVKNTDGKSFTIGFDCLETLLINNSLLSTNDIAQYERAKKMIPKILRFAKQVKETLSNSKTVTGLAFEKRTYESDFFPFYWLQNHCLVSRDNDYVKLKEMDLDFLIETLRNIFPQLTIFIKAG